MADCDECGATRPRWHGGVHVCTFPDSSGTYRVGPETYFFDKHNVEFLRADYAGLR
jgi:hypothetical protein